MSVLQDNANSLYTCGTESSDGSPDEGTTRQEKRYRKSHIQGCHAMFTAPVLWFAAAVVFFVLEMLVPAGAFLFFAAGCLAGWLAALAGTGLTWQILIAVCVCILALLVLRRRLTRVFSGKQDEDGASSPLVGATGRVTVPLLNGTEGQVYVAGSYWRAASDAGDLGEGEEIRVARIDPADTQLLHVLAFVKTQNRQESETRNK